MRWYLEVLKKYTQFSGRARRKEYWLFALFNLIFLIVAAIFDHLIFGVAIEAIGPLYAIYVLAVIIPGLAVAVRRLHDIGKSGWYFLINFIPLVGGIWFLVLMCLDSQPGENRFGPNPKEPEYPSGPSDPAPPQLPSRG